MRKGSAVDILKLAADRNPVGNAAGFDLMAARNFRDDVRRCFALDRRVRREDSLFHFAFREQRFQLVETQLLRTNAIEWRKMAHQNEVATAKAP